MRPRGAGNRLLNTAAYFNEEAVGAAVKSCGIPCKELFITTKLWIQDTGYGETLRSFDASLKKLGLDYLDLYLIHQPFWGNTTAPGRRWNSSMRRGASGPLE